ncbi:hypothetical protein BC941DRAFT_426063 [Chlamydoabsidia padenii]|nr:hypothetical protein BC941DRAFT_426063 [Chlamydoabsidia padenii]
MFQSFCKQDDIFKHTKEVPAEMPVYEGYLYWYSDKQKWKWHLFRFDGLSFVCLSSRKVKLPRGTPIDPLDGHHQNDPILALSPTSPLLATPKKQPHEPYTDDNVVMASHCHLPSWSVNLLQVSSISLFAPTSNDKPLLLQHQQHQQVKNCFCLRTFDNKCYVLKARKHKDLDRWLFILTKAWDWARIQRQQQEEYHQEIKCPSLPPQLPPLNISSFGIKSKKSSGPPTPPLHFSTPPRHDEYDVNYTNVSLSPEKTKWIDEWRDSIQLTAMALEPDSHYTSYTAEQQPTCIFVKKKRSDEVKNWISTSYQTQDHQDYDVHYFQDANTTTDHANDTPSSTPRQRHSQDQSQPPNTPPSLHYHRSIRGKNIQIVHHDPKIAGIISATTIPIQQLLPTPPFDNHSPLHTLSKAESTQDVYNLQSTYHRRLSAPMDDTNTTCNQVISTSHSLDTTPSIVPPSIPPQSPASTTSSFLKRPLSLIKQLWLQRPSS